VKGARDIHKEGRDRGSGTGGPGALKEGGLHLDISAGVRYATSDGAGLPT